MDSADFNRKRRAKARRQARHKKRQSMYAEETRVEAVNAVTLFTAGIVAKDRKNTLTVPDFIKAMDRLEEMIESKEVLEQLKDPDAPEVGKDDQYVVCAILMNWKHLLSLADIDTDLLGDVVRGMRARVAAEGLRTIAAPEQVIERYAQSGQHASKMHDSLQRMLAALAAHRASLDASTDDPD